MVGQAKSNWHWYLFSTLCTYRNTVKTSSGFIPFQLVYGMEATLPIECEIPSLKFVVELLHNITIDEERVGRMGHTRVLMLLSLHQQIDPQCWPFRQQPANRLQSHPKQLWGAAESGFCRQKRDIIVPLVLTKYTYTIQSFDIQLNSFVV